VKIIKGSHRNNIKKHNPWQKVDEDTRFPLEMRQWDRPLLIS
jgi:hypothetical protein